MSLAGQQPPLGGFFHSRRWDGALNRKRPLRWGRSLFSPGGRQSTAAPGVSLIPQRPLGFSTLLPAASLADPSGRRAIHRILISATHKSSGKTTIRIGLAAALNSANPRRPGLRSPHPHCRRDPQPPRRPPPRNQAARRDRALHRCPGDQRGAGTRLTDAGATASRIACHHAISRN